MNVSSAFLHFFCRFLEVITERLRCFFHSDVLDDPSCECYTDNLMLLEKFFWWFHSAIFYVCIGGNACLGRQYKKNICWDSPNYSRERKKKKQSDVFEHSLSRLQP